MKIKRILSLLLSVILLTFVVSCSEKDETQPEEQQQKEAPQLTTQTVQVPETMAQSDDPGAQEATALVSIANAFSGFAGLMIPPPQKCGIYKSTNDDPWTYTWEFNEGEDNYTVTLTIIETLTHYEWDMVINGVLDGLVLVDFIYMEATETLDGGSGSYYMYDPETQGPEMKVDWLTDSNGIYTVSFEIPEDVIIEMTSNLDGSGEVSEYDWFEGEYVISFRAVWTAAGTGEYWEYYEGELIDHGEW